MAKHRRRRRSPDTAAWLGPAHRPGCSCAGDHCGQADALTASRRRLSYAARMRLSVDNTATFHAARSVGLSVRRSDRQG